jgi:ABC-type lipoprotein export system ATPase subunit
MVQASQKLILVESACKTFHRDGADIRAMDQVNFEADRAQLVAIVGPSGAGKSTLLNVLGGLDRLDAGRITVDSLDISSLPEERMADYRRETVGFIFQAFHLMPTLSVAENVMMPLVPRRLRPEDRLHLTQEALEAAGIAHRATHLPRELSGGEQQRAAIARALVNRPRLILADEPTGQLDATTGERVIELLERLVAERGCTVIAASHDRSIASRAHRTLAMTDGKLSE